MSQITVYITTKTMLIETAENEGPCCVAYTSKRSKRCGYIYMLHSVL